MSTETTTNTSQITLVHPDGSIKLMVPTDVPVAELMPDFLDVARQPDGDDWELGHAAGDPFEDEQQTLSELGVSDGDVLVLHEHEAKDAAPQDHEPALEMNPRRPASRPRRAPQPQTRPSVAPRPLRERTVRTLPELLSRPARIAAAARALTGGQPETHRHVTGIPDPATFTRPARVSPVARVRETWTRSDYQYRLDDLIVGPRLRGCVTIAVVSPKGGVGKSTVTALLGSLLSFLRRDRTVAVETNPDWGSLGRRLVPEHAIFIDDLLAGPLAEGKLKPTQLDALLGRGPDGLLIAPAPTDPDRAAKLDEQAYRTLFERLGELVGTLVLDCGTGLDDPPARAALGCADQLVLVCDDEPDTASIVAEAADWLQRIQPPLTLVVNNVRRASQIEIGALEREIDFARGLAIVPRDEGAAAQLHGSQFSWNRARRRWRLPVSELAALLASDWVSLDLSHLRKPAQTEPSSPNRTPSDGAGDYERAHD
jgi:MinD-like ATPase involved in chromosome partitioning or flagellar assembly